MQPVFIHYKCVTYVCPYFTRNETEGSKAVVNAAKEAIASNLNIRDGLKKIGAAFFSGREVSLQECVYRARLFKTAISTNPRLNRLIAD